MKILLADDHSLFREGMRHVLARFGDDTQVVEAGDCDEVLRQAAAHEDIGLVLLDLNMPGRDGFAALDVLSQRYPLMPIVVLSASESRDDMRRAFDAGATGFIPKSSTAAVMLSAIELVLAGGVYVPPALLDLPRAAPGAASHAAPHAEPRLAPHAEPRLTPHAEPRLTPRQLDVLAGVIEGKPNKLIAAELSLTVATVKAHVTAVFKALNVSNRTQAAFAAERLGLRRHGGND